MDLSAALTLPRKTPTAAAGETPVPPPLRLVAGITPTLAPTPSHLATGLAMLPLLATTGVVPKLVPVGRSVLPVTRSEHQQQSGHGYFDITAMSKEE